MLRQELAKLSEVDQKAIRQTLQVDRLSAETVLRIFKTSGGTVAAQLLIGGCGFGAYVFLATTLKAIGLLFGATFAFGTYAHASSSLAFALSGWFSLLVLLVGGSFVVMDTAARLDGWKAQLVVVLGHARLLDYPVACRC